MPFIELKRVEHLAYLFTGLHLYDYVRMTSTNDVASYWSMTRSGYYQYIGKAGRKST